MATTVVETFVDRWPEGRRFGTYTSYSAAQGRVWREQGPRR
jgi:hypothetical protein